MKRDIINVQGKWYNLLLMSGGKAYLSNLFDTYNEVEKEGVIWEMQPFFYQNEIWYGPILQKIIYKLRQFKKWRTKN
jgi:hypothetical protein